MITFKQLITEVVSKEEELHRKLFRAHDIEIERKGAKVWNHGNYADDRSVTSKTDHGVLETIITKFGITKHKWH